MRYNWLGHPDGRDAMLFALGSTLSKKNLAFFLDISFARKGEHTLMWDWNKGQGYNDQHTPSGTAENKLTMVLGSTWKILPYLTLSGQIAGNFVFNAGHISGHNKYGLDTALSVTFVY
jgi:hypothetical protein